MATPPASEEESLLLNLVYCSRAVGAFDAEELAQLVGVAQRRNAQISITGWLVYSNGIFFQWLEGSQATVKSLMASIRSDPRHENIVILSEEEEVRGRVFAGWDMELVSASDIRGVLLDAMDTALDGNNRTALSALLHELDVTGGEVAPTLR